MKLGVRLFPLCKADKAFYRADSSGNDSQSSHELTFVFLIGLVHHALHGYDDHIHLETEMNTNSLGFRRRNLSYRGIVSFSECDVASTSRWSPGWADTSW